MLNATAPIHQFMTRSLPRVTPETALSEARELMEENRLQLFAGCQPRAFRGYPPRANRCGC